MISTTPWTFRQLTERQPVPPTFAPGATVVMIVVDGLTKFALPATPDEQPDGSVIFTATCLHDGLSDRVRGELAWRCGDAYLPLMIFGKAA